MGVYPDERAFGANAGSADTPEAECTRCGHAGLSESSVSTAFWRGKGLMVIRDIPALVCPACGEEFIADHVALGLDRMRGDGFRAEMATEHMEVPVFRFAGGPGA